MSRCGNEKRHRVVLKDGTCFFCHRLYDADYQRRQRLLGISWDQRHPEEAARRKRTFRAFMKEYRKAKAEYWAWLSDTADEP